MPGRKLCEKHCSFTPARWKPKASPTIEAASQLLASKRWTKRKEGMRMLGELHASELIIQYAIKETVAAVIDEAWGALERPPIELVKHTLTLPSAYDSILHMRFSIARGNFIYAEEAIRNIYSKRRTLSLDVIEGIGRAYLKSLATLLTKYGKVSLELYDDALHSKGQKAVAGVDGVHVNGWSRNGWAAIYSIIALCRLDAHFNHEVAERLLNEAEQIQRQLPLRDFQEKRRRSIHRSILGTRAWLEWALFDKGARTSPDKVIDLVRDGAIEVLPDLATTFQKRGNERQLSALAREFPTTFFVEAEFCFWPLMNWLEFNDFLTTNEYGTMEGMSLECFWKAFHRDISPPSWWKWRRRSR